jgi:hypothetical protein
MAAPPAAAARRRGCPATRKPTRLAASSSSSPAASSDVSGISGDVYVVTPAQIEAFQRDGYVHLRGVLTEEEMPAVEEPVMRFMRGEVRLTLNFATAKKMTVGSQSCTPTALTAQLRPTRHHAPRENAFTHTPSITGDGEW